MKGDFSNGVSTLLSLGDLHFIVSFMQRTLTIPPLGVSDVDSSPVFNVVIAYEDFESGKQAMKTYDFLAQNFGSDCHFTNQMWKFDVLSIPKLREIAVKDAALADIIIISCGVDALPAHVKTWIESWVVQPNNPLALVALFEDTHDGLERSASARDYLANLAQHAGIEFFARPDERSGRPRREEPFHFQRGSGVDDYTLSALAGKAHQDLTPPRWGINE